MVTEEKRERKTTPVPLPLKRVSMKVVSIEKAVSSKIQITSI